MIFFYFFFNLILFHSQSNRLHIKIAYEIGTHALVTPLAQEKGILVAEWSKQTFQIYLIKPTCIVDELE